MAPWLYTKLRRRDVAPDVAEYVTQEALVRLLTRIHGVDRKREGGSSKGWLFTVALNCLRHEIRQENRIERKIGQRLDADILRTIEASSEQADDSGQVPGDPTRELTMVNAIRSVKSRVTPETWQTFIRMYCDGLTEKQAAEEFGISPHTAKMRKLRTLKKLREHGIEFENDVNESEEGEDQEPV